MTTYTPAPLDTRDIALSPSLQSLLEKLAENTHEVWSAQRIRDGWTHGPTRDDTAKKHSCLVPYADLPESERLAVTLYYMEDLRLKEIGEVLKLSESRVSRLLKAAEHHIEEFIRAREEDAA